MSRHDKNEAEIGSILPFEPNTDIYKDPTERRGTLRSRRVSKDNESLKGTTHLKSLFEKHPNALRDLTHAFNEDNKENTPSSVALEIINFEQIEQLPPPETFFGIEPTPEAYQKLLQCYKSIWESLN